MQIQNRDRLKRKLAAMSPIAKEEIRKVLGESAEEIAATARSMAPVDSGDLRDSIRWRFGDAQSNRKAVLRAKAGSADHELSVTIEAGDYDAFYARFVEFGTAATPARGPRLNFNLKRLGIMTKAYKAHAATPAQPFFYPAFRLGKKRAKNRIARGIRRAAKKVAGA